MSKIVTIVGRPNVGKSTFFNRLLGKRKAIVASISGVTRDRHYGKSEWNGVEFSVIDTGGYTRDSIDIFQKEIKTQIEFAISESSVILFLVDGQTGITSADREVAHFLRKSNQFIFLVVNKVDNSRIDCNTFEFYELGFKKIYCISSVSGSGTGDLLDDVVKKLPTNSYIDPFIKLPKVTIIGRPNVGKSTFYNILLGTNRSIVTDIPGTTRDSIETIYKQFGYEFILVDTAGIRKKNKIFENLEFYSIMRSIRAVEHSNIVIIMIDATRGWESQDMNIFSLAEKNRKNILIVVNKWDLVEKNTNSMKNFEEIIKKKIAPFTDVPIIFVSSINKQRILKVVEVVMQVHKNQNNRIKTSKLNEIMLQIINKYPPPSVKGKSIKIKYCTQLPTYLPQFAFFCNFPQYIKEAYQRYIENQLRINFNFTGVPIQIFFRKK